MVAVNAAGSSVDSSPSAVVTPFTVPGAVSFVGGVSSGKGRQTLVWVSALPHGSAVARYDVSWRIQGTKRFGSWVKCGKSTKCVVKGWLAGKTYQVRVRATNAAGSTISKAFSLRQAR